MAQKGTVTRFQDKHGKDCMQQHPDQIPVERASIADSSAAEFRNETTGEDVSKTHTQESPMHLPLPSFLESADRRLLRSFTAWSVSAMFAFSLIIGVVRTTGNLGAFALRSFAQATSALLPHDDEGHVNILLLGVGDRSHSAASLTDSMIVASIDPDTQSVVLLSIPRDLYVEDAKDAPAGRINSLYVMYKNQYKKVKGTTESGASLLAMDALASDIGTRLGTEIHGVMKMDFVGFTEIVDAVGGVDVDVPQTLVDYTYPLREGVVGKFSLEKGPQHLDGETALRYARSRHSTTDFDRSARQQQILRALSEKVKSMNVLGNSDVIHSVEMAIRNHFETTLSRGELFALAGTLVSVRKDRILSMHLNFETGGDYSDAATGGFVRSPAPGEYSGAILLPYSLTNTVSDWSQIHSFAQMIFTKRDAYFADPLLALDGTDAKSVQTHRLKNELVRYGFRVEETKHEKTDEPVTETTMAVLKNGDKNAAGVLSEILKMPLERTSEVASATDATIRITLGKDYTFTTISTLQGEEITQD